MVTSLVSMAKRKQSMRNGRDGLLCQEKMHRFLIQSKLPTRNDLSQTMFTCKTCSSLVRVRIVVGTKRNFHTVALRIRSTYLNTIILFLSKFNVLVKPNWYMFTSKLCTHNRYHRSKILRFTFPLIFGLVQEQSHRHHLPGYSQPL